MFWGNTFGVVLHLCGLLAQFLLTVGPGDSQQVAMELDA